MEQRGCVTDERCVRDRQCQYVNENDKRKNDSQQQQGREREMRRAGREQNFPLSVGHCCQATV